MSASPGLTRSRQASPDLTRSHPVPPGLTGPDQASPGRDRGPLPEPAPGPSNETARGQGKEVNGIKIGEPNETYDIADSICYSHNWFSRKDIDGVPHAQCLLCLHSEEEARASGKASSNSRKKKKDCLKTLQGTTKPMFTHMEAHHQPEYEQFLRQHNEVENARAERRKRKRSGDGTMQLKLFSNNNNQVGLDNRLDPKLQARWDDAVVKFVSETGISFFNCEKLGILLEAIWPNGKLRLKVKSRVTVSRHVKERSLSLKVEVFSILISVAQEDGGLPGIAFTSDLWRSRALDSFMALTCHFINASMELIKLVPFIQYFGDNRHTGYNIKLMMDQFLRVIGMDGDQVAKVCVTDNASNNKVMFRLSNGVLTAYYCNIHTMQLAIEEVFKLTIINIHVTEAMDKCHDLATFVRRSELNKNELKKACQHTETNFAMPKLPNDTRWNSKEENVATTIVLKPPLQRIQQRDTDQRWADVMPNAAEFNLLESLVEILSRVKVANKNWEGDLKPTIQNVIPELFDIKDTLEKKHKNKERYVSVFARELKKLIEGRFPNSGTENVLNCIAHLLDPEYKGVILKQYRGCYEKTRDEIIRMGREYENVQAPVVQVTRAEENEEPDAEEHLSAAQRLKRKAAAASVGVRARAEIPSLNNDRSQTELELEKYEAMDIPNCSDLLLFYKDNSNVFPLLTKIARRVFAIPASSATSERVFSIGSLICSAKRSRLLPDKLADLMLLKLNSMNVAKYNEKYKYEKKFTPAQTDNIIRIDLEAMDNPEIDINREGFVEDIEGDHDDDAEEVTLFEVEDNIL